MALSTMFIWYLVILFIGYTTHIGIDLRILNNQYKERGMGRSARIEEVANWGSKLILWFMWPIYLPIFIVGYLGYYTIYKLSVWIIKKIGA